MDKFQGRASREVEALAEAVLSSRIDRREFFRRSALLGVSASAAGGILAACSSSTSPSSTRAQKGGTLVYGPLADGENYDPSTNIYDFPSPPFSSVYEGLLAYAPGTLNAGNLLAQAVEKSADGKTYTFTLKQGVQFHHGYGEVTAADVKYSFERNAGLRKLYPGAPKSAVSYYAGDMPGLEEVKVTGKYSGQIVFKEPFVPFQTITLPWATSGYIIPQKAVEKYGSAWARHPVGTGPYQVASYTPNSEMVLQRFADYSGANAKLGARNWFDEIRIMLTPLNSVPKGEAATVALQSGQADFTPNLGALDIQRLRGNSAFRTYSPAAPLNYSFLALDVQNPKLKDVRVRQAVRYALNIPEIITVNRLPSSTRLNSLISKQMGAGFWADAPVYTRDVPKAKALLAAAGVSNLTLEIATPAIASAPGEPNQVMQVIQSNLKDVGIAVNIIETPPDSYIAKAGFGSMAWSNFGGAPDPYYQFEWFTCSQIGVWNYASWCDKKYTALENKLGTTADAAEREKISIDMQRLIDQAASFVWISTGIGFAASKSSVMAVFDRNANPLLHYFQKV
ncbi:MAG: ABC transporter substrate-binding protein [Streptosporangiaceae bacterium]